MEHKDNPVLMLHVVICVWGAERRQRHLRAVSESAGQRFSFVGFAFWGVPQGRVRLAFRLKPRSPLGGGAPVYGTHSGASGTCDDLF